jgi:murein L,D-transpeptidase YcbB/YkuD
MVDELMSAIAAAPAHGLDPEDYHYQALTARLDIAAKGLRGATSTVNLDLLLTDALARYALTLHFGKLDPEDLDPEWNLSREFGDDDIVDHFFEVLETGEIARFLEEASPRFPPYRRLMEALTGYRELAAAGGWPTVPDGSGLKAGQRDPRVTDLRARLAVTDGLRTGAGDDAEAFDDAVEEAVIRFQRRHGLDPDGKVGPKTIVALNVTARARVDQIRANLERARWVFRDMDDDYIIADIAGFQLLLFRDNEPVWTTRIQVGKPYHATPVFTEEMTYLVLNPTWTIPPGILRKETLPAARKDPSYLKNRNMSIIRSDGSVVDPATVDLNGKFPYGIRQEPGPNNALGRVKFIFPNQFFVYFHDTPSKSLFGRSARAFSHGCIRTENPLDLAELLLADKEGWDRARIDKVIKSEKMTTVTLTEPMTVFLLYWTVDPQPEGTVHFRDDIYSRDARIIEGLDKPFQFKRPGNLPASLQ